MTKHNHTPQVSVLMPVYNGQRYLAEAVDSILNQTFRDFEFIIIDDGSNDETAKILAGYAQQDPRVILSTNSENLGLIKTLNRGIAIAKGKYIARHDADDISLPERLKKQVSYLDAHPEIGILGTAYYRLDSEGQRLLRQPPVSDTVIRWRLLFGNIWCHASIMLRRELIDGSESFFQNFPHAEDYEAWIRLLEVTCGATLETPLVLYRIHHDSVSSTQRERQVPMVDFISAQRISTVLCDLAPSADQVSVIRKCLHPDRIAGEDLMVGGSWMLKLLNTFQQQKGIDPAQVKDIRRRWIRKWLTSVPLFQWKVMRRHSETVNALRKHRMDIFLVMALLKPLRMVRRILSNRGSYPILLQ